MQHPEEGMIHAWLDGALPANEAATIESHVASCAECEARVAEARGLIAASSRIVGHLDAVPANVIPAARPKRRMLTWRSPIFAAAAALLFFVVRGYYDWPGKDGVREIAIQRPVPGVIPVTPRDSMPVAVPPRQVEPQTSRARDRAVAPMTAMADSLVQLPPANAAMQKADVASTQPTAAPPPPPTVGPQRIREDRIQANRALSEVVVTGTRAATGAAAGSVASATAKAPAAAPERMSLAAADESAPSFAGCYEMNTSTGVLPARFALTSDSSSVRGLLGIRYVDAEGRPVASISDVGWAVEGGQVVVRTLAGETLLTMQRTGSAVAGQSRSGSRNGRVTSCNR